MDAQSSRMQTDASYKDFVFAIKVCVKPINSYLDLMSTGFAKNIFIAGFSGGGKTFVMMYIVIYDRSKGLTVIKVSIMCHQEIQLGGWHWQNFLYIPVDIDNRMYLYQITELEIHKL